MFGYKIYNTVIMDGTNLFVNREIAGIIDMITRRRIGRSICRRLDKDHPTMRVIKRFTSARKYHDARRLIEKNYPALCTFDATI